MFMNILGAHNTIHVYMDANTVYFRKLNLSLLTDEIECIRVKRM